MSAVKPARAPLVRRDDMLSPPPRGTQYYELPPFPIIPGHHVMTFTATCATCPRARQCVMSPHEPLLRCLQRLDYHLLDGKYYCPHCWGKH